MTMMTMMTMSRCLWLSWGLLWDKPDDRPHRHHAWSQRCDDDDPGENREPIWIIDAISEWLGEITKRATLVGENAS